MSSTRRAANASADGPAFTPSALFRPLAWIVCGFGLLKFTADVDLWGHVRFGQDILRDRGLSTVDPYSFTQDVDWVNHEWLSELMMGLAWNAAGTSGLLALKLLLAGSTYLVLYDTIRRGNAQFRWAVLALAAWGTLPLVWTLRPQLWTLLLLALLCRVMATSRGVLYVPALFFVWANVHGGWILGLGVWLVWSATHLVDPESRARCRLLLAVALASMLATLANPYGWGLWQFVARTVRLSRADIVEWTPLWVDPMPAVIWIPTMLFGAWHWRTYGRPAKPVLAVTLMLAAASANVARLVPLFALTVTMLLPGAPKARDVRVPRARTFLDLAAVFVAMFLAASVGAIPTCIAIDPTVGPDPAPVEALKAAGATGRIITPFNWGEYAIWHLSPRLKISMDGRRETVYSMKTLQEQYDIASGTRAGLAALARLDPDFVWLSSAAAGPTGQWLRHNGYRIDLEGERSILAVRATLPVVTPVPYDATGCFPGP